MFVFDLKINFVCVVCAMFIDFVLGDPDWLPHPIIWIGKLIKKIEIYLRKKYENDIRLKKASIIMVLIVCFITFCIPYGILMIINNKKIYIVINTLIIWTTIAAKSLHKAGMEVYNALSSGELDEARVKLSYIVGRDTQGLSTDEIIRADIETIAENTSDGIIAPIFYGLLGGAPLAMMYKGINTMDSMVGYLNEKYKNIGFFPAKVDDIFNYIPARITGGLMCISSPIVKGDIFKSFKIMVRDRKNHKSPNCAYPEGATAGALRVQLGGSNFYFGEIVYKPTIGDNIENLHFNHIKQSIILMYSSEILLLTVITICVFIF